ncbi:DUF4185 domain-containing protein [Propioniciclava tarda]|uniref:DUF4185 domain-containing protein n=1 Tax=Propioniciclava tarda TaxID=433330 RepID=A0A4Q9KLI6_PROTD|nr:DUF4185 domain-containing protein [Propioniciclava tarda]SMO68863.1 protein of unknown function [Propioniciclava tarda]
MGPRSLLQGTVPADRRLRSLARVRRLEAVVLSPDGARLFHYHRDQTRPDRPWVRGELISDAAAGPGTIRQARGTLRQPGDLLVDVPENTADGPRIARYVRSFDDPGRRWRRLGDAAVPVGAQPDSADGWTGPPGAVAVAIARTTLAGLPAIGNVLSALPGGDGALALPTFDPGGEGWLQALVQEGASVYQWHRQEWGGRQRWVRASCLRFHPDDGFEVEDRPSIKLAQVTGERDSQPSAPDVTLSASESRSGVRGTDLGVRFDHAGRSFLLFGDTHWTARTRATRDAMGELTPAGPRGGLPGVTLHGTPLRIVGGAATSREYDVPLDAFSLDGELYCFFSSHHFQRHQVMGRSLLTRALDPDLPISGAARRRPISFAKVATFSDRFFVNVSVQVRGGRLYVWGSGSYRADDLRLAEFDLTSPALLGALAGESPWTRPQVGVRYWSGLRSDGTPRWSPHESDAAAVVLGAFGEVSVRWVDELDAYVLLAMDGPEDPVGKGVTLRSARQPWGPWSPRRRLFDWELSGKSYHDEASRFIRAHHRDDPVGDAMFGAQKTMTGAAYAPYLFDARREGSAIVLRYTLSTWNPYQVVLMEHRLSADAVRAISGAG